MFLTLMLTFFKFLDNIFFCTMQIYAQDRDNSLPSYDEVLLCSESTTLEQVCFIEDE